MIATLLWKLLKIVVKAGLKVFFRLQISGEENIPPPGKAIVLGNQESLFSALVLEASVRDTLYWAILPSLYKNPCANIFLKLLGCFPLNPLVPDTESFKKAFDVLNKSKMLAFFPGKINLGIVLFSLRAGCRILPVVISKKKAFIPLIRISFGESYDFHEYRNMPASITFIEKITQTINHSFETLLKKTSI